MTVYFSTIRVIPELNTMMKLKKKKKQHVQVKDYYENIVAKDGEIKTYGSLNKWR